MTPAIDSLCGACGKKGRRECPALGKPICTNCCGEKRGSQLACPPSCPHFPFGSEAYDLWFKVEGQWLAKSLDYIADHVGLGVFEDTARRLAPGRPDEEDSVDLGTINAMHYLLGIRRDDQGRTLGEKWEQEGWCGLNNDERVMVRYRRDSRPALIEVQRIFDSQALECVDLIEPDRGKFRILDHTLASRVVRFAILFTWITHYPHFSRPLGTSVEVPADRAEEFKGQLAGLAHKSSGSRSVAALKTYMAENFGECCTLLARLCERKRDEALRSLDLKQYRAIYRLAAARNRIRQAILSRPDFQPDDRAEDTIPPPREESFVWRSRPATEFGFWRPAFLRRGKGNSVGGVLGRLALSGDRMVVEAVSEGKFTLAKDLVKDYFPGMVEFDRYEVEDFVQKAMEQPPSSPSPVSDAPPAGKLPPETEQVVMGDFFRRYYASLLDAPIPMLGGVTPRAAARDRKRRPKLVAWLKRNIHQMDTLSREHGIKLDIQWVLEELGVDELR